jgi:hypothetical protein
LQKKILGHHDKQDEAVAIMDSILVEVIPLSPMTVKEVKNY